jgi:hypothetical protein
MNHYQSLSFDDPEDLLNRIMPEVTGILQNPISVSHLDHRAKKLIMEQYQGAYMAMLVKCCSCELTKVSVCVAENEDYDCVIRGEMPTGDIVFKQVQLKHLPSHEVNQDVALQEIISKLAKYNSSSELMVAIWINRDVRFNLTDLDFTGLTFEQLWLFGDSTSGPLEIHGGPLSDWNSGVCWEAIIQNLKPTIRHLRFRPKEATK